MRRASSQPAAITAAVAPSHSQTLERMPTTDVCHDEQNDCPAFGACAQNPFETIGANSTATAITATAVATTIQRERARRVDIPSVSPLSLRPAGGGWRVG